MKRAELTDLSMERKRERNLPADKAALLAERLELPDGAVTLLAEFPTKIFPRTVPSDPCIYRFHEIVGTYGETLKELIQEKGGDGIMSAIDYDMSVEKVLHPGGDRIEVRVSGKLLPYNAW